MSPQIAIIMPIYGQHDLTRSVLRELAQEGDIADVWLVDNRGDFEPERSVAHVIRPGRNLGWTVGCNVGVSAAWERTYEAFLLLNNDVRLSRFFVRGLVDAMGATGGALVGPVYDHNWPQQRTSYLDAAEGYCSRALEREVPFVDGTCMLIPRSTLECSGFLDEECWPKHGWGCDKDYALRARRLGGTVWVTERSYLNHLGRQTAKGFEDYSEDAAEEEHDRGMEMKWGSTWRDLLYQGFTDMNRLGKVQQRLAARPH